MENVKKIEVDKSGINKGVELMLRQKTKTGEEQDHFKMDFAHMISLFGREFHFDLKISIKKGNSRR